MDLAALLSHQGLPGEANNNKEATRCGTKRNVSTKLQSSLQISGFLGLFCILVTTDIALRLNDRVASQEVIQGWGPLGLRGLSHVCINVPDVDEAFEFYHRVLGFEIMQAGKRWGDFDFRNMTNEAFCKDAGFLDGKCKLDCLWLKHPHMNINLELFHYYEPASVNHLIEKLPDTHDIGGIKHISYAVDNAEKAFNFLREQRGVTMINTNSEYFPVRMDPFPFKFFYWRDPYGVQWECEEGDKVMTRQISGLTRIMDDYIEYKN